MVSVCWVFQELIILQGSFTITHAGVLIQEVTSWTTALEASEGVDTFPSLAKPGELLALVDIYPNENQSMSSAL
jgi:hypothetical protein